MDFKAFSRRAQEILEEIPREFLVDVIGVDVHRMTKTHPQLPEFFTLGECEDDPVSRLGDPGTIRSRVHLYHGSFGKVARGDPDFDWEGELRETILHEIRHHLEDRAGIKDLLDEDLEDEILARFAAGEELPDRWYRAGEEMDRGVYRVGDDLFVELDLRPAELSALRGTTARLKVLDEPFEPEVPEDAEAGEMLTWEGEGLEGEHGGYGDLHLVLLEHRPGRGGWPWSSDNGR